MDHIGMWILHAHMNFVNDNHIYIFYTHLKISFNFRVTNFLLNLIFLILSSQINIIDVI